ncbi:RHS repeat-associated core domain-containing protein [Pseudescherichia vulneris]|uniref:RHS repeat-associated core domain-containing protein n=1 Tax=Pseudescherichia vulneris TaxID=566 RepID=UPI001EDE305F|nr:RHS repeat-associated core domain-containing protein [Pseudescherichia vulneris]
MSNSNIATGTPVVNVTDNRGLTVRTLNWNREQSADPLRLLAGHAYVDDASRVAAYRDPRLFTAWTTDNASSANLFTMPSLTGQLLRRESSDSGEQVTLFDVAGHQVWTRDGHGTVQTIAYDELGRPESGSEQLSGSSEIRVSWRSEYGDSGTADNGSQGHNLRGVNIAQYDDGGLHSVSEVTLSGAVFSQTQRFLLSAEDLPDWPEDEVGRKVLLETEVYPTTTAVDARGAVLNQTDAAGHMQTWQYDVSGHARYQDVTPAGGESLILLAGITWSAAGQVMTESAGNGVTTTYGYDPQNQWLATITAQRTDSTTLQDLSYGYDFTGNVTSVTDCTVAAGYYRNQSTSGIRQFTYDALYQLLSATGRENANNTAMQYSALPVVSDGNQYVNYTRSYFYDDSGNLKTLKHTGAGSFTRTMTTDTTSNRSVQQNDGGPQTPDEVANWFDANGNLLTLQASATADDALAWDGSNNLQEVALLSRSSGDNDREIYQYSGSQRVRKQTRTLVNGDSQLWNIAEVRYLPGLELRKSWQETVGSSAPPSLTEELHVLTGQAGRAGIRLLHWESGKPDGINNNQVRWRVDDNIGSLSLELDSEGQLISREEYYPFGGTAVWTGRNKVEASYKTVRYSGKERDGTGLYYYGHRYYAPWLCRWVSADPAGEVDGLNLYRMVGNNPLTLQDVGGLAGKSWRDSSAKTQERFTALSELLLMNESTAAMAQKHAPTGETLYNNMANESRDAQRMMHTLFQSQHYGALNLTVGMEQLQHNMVEFLDMLTKVTQKTNYQKQFDSPYSKVNRQHLGEAARAISNMPIDDHFSARLKAEKEKAVGGRNVLSATLESTKSPNSTVKVYALSGATAGRLGNFSLDESKKKIFVTETFNERRDEASTFSPISLQRGGNSIDRSNDTEVKMMKLFFEKMQQKPEDSYRAEVFSYLPVCHSCQTVLTWSAKEPPLDPGQTLRIDMSSAPLPLRTGRDGATFSHSSRQGSYQPRARYH